MKILRGESADLGSVPTVLSQYSSLNSVAVMVGSDFFNLPQSLRLLSIYASWHLILMHDILIKFHIR